jgi:hypothetical protein
MGGTIQAFQGRVWGWLVWCFERKVVDNLTERCDRALEEHLELLQSLGYDRDRIPALVDYVYGRPAGDPRQEVGGVMVTLSALCSVANLDLDAAAHEELTRINKPDVMMRIREKQASKRDIHSPLPGVTP